VALIDERRDALNESYARLTAKLSAHPRLDIPAMHQEVTPVVDSLQFRVRDATPEQVDAVIDHVKQHGQLTLARFGADSNARNWRTWQFIPGIDSHELPQTDLYIGSALDIRLEPMDDGRIQRMVDSIHAGLDAVFRQ